MCIRDSKYATIWEIRLSCCTTTEAHFQNSGIFPFLQEICLIHVYECQHSSETSFYNLILKHISQCQVLENRVRRHAPRIRRGTRNCAEISAAPFGAVVAERVMRRRFARVPTSLKPAVQRLQAPATVTASNSSYCVTIF